MEGARARDGGRARTNGKEGASRPGIVLSRQVHLESCGDILAIRDLGVGGYVIVLNEVIRDSKYAFTRTPRPLIPKRALRVKFRSPTIQYALVLAQVLVLVAVVVIIAHGSAL